TSRTPVSSPSAATCATRSWAIPTAGATRFRRCPAPPRPLRLGARRSATPREVAFALVDVFTETPLGGTPLALVPDAESLYADLMGRGAREFNQSETTFLLPPTRPKADWRLRCFTPTGAEVFGAGHNALGAWWWLAEAGRLSRGRTAFAQELGDAVLPVEVAWGPEGPEAVVMTQAPP